MKKQILFLAASLMTGVAVAQDAPGWLRNSAISPDGKTVAFTYDGDIYTIPVGGGKATQLTMNPAYDSYPAWSPDGKQIAFSSDRFGGFDVFIMSADGGSPKRLTTHSANEYVETFKDTKHVLYRSSIMPTAEDGVFPSGTYPQVYEVSTDGGRPRLFSSLTMESLSMNSAGQLLYQDKKGYEDTWRKHHQSPITRDIWLSQSTPVSQYTKLTSFKGEDRNPIWAADGKSFYYLSEQKGTMNVYKRNVTDGKETQLTSFTKHPVRYLSVSKNGTLCFSFNGELYIQPQGEKAQKLNVNMVKDNTVRDMYPVFNTSGSSSMSVSSDEKEIAFICRGDVYVTSVDYQTTKRITNTPEEERSVCFSPDGRSVVYASERNGVWGIYRTSLVRDNDKQFVYAHELKEEPLIVGNEACYMPQFSPDGKEIAYFANRTELRIYNLKSKSSRVVMPEKFNYSYTDGDQYFDWSPDSKWLLTKYIGIGGWNNVDVALVKADGSRIENLTESGYSDGNAKWVLDGKAMIWQSDRAGYRSHGSWGAENDIYLMFFDEEAYDRFKMNKEERALYDERKKATEEKKEDKKEDKKDSKKDKKGKETKKEDKKEDLKFDLENRKDRIIRLTGNSSHLGEAYLSQDGRKLYYQAAFEGGYDLWVRDLDDYSTRILVKGFGGGEMIPDKEGKKLYVGNWTLRKVDLSDGNVSNIPFSAQSDYRPKEERTYIFDHIASLVNDKYFDKEILKSHDWDFYTKNYKKFLPYINNNYDFAEMLSEMLGELDASHTGARYGGTGAALPTAALGAFIDESYTGDGLCIKEIIKNGPLDYAGSKITNGCIIQKINGQPILKGADYYPLLAGKANERVTTLTITDSKGKNSFEQDVKLISYGQQEALLYRRWVEKCREMTEKYSKGEVGYVHVKGMDSNSFREVYSDILGKYRNCKAILVDTRHNGGGWLHNDLAILLSGKEFQRYVPRGQYIGSDPYMRWYKPSAVLVCEDNYSNAHGFPAMYKALGIGKLIGTPIAGTMTAVWWERQVDNSLVFGVPQVGIKDMNGHYLENQQLNPDIEVYNTPEQQLKDDDVQLKTAVEHLLKISK